jgi:hypothetical protein
MAKKNCIIFGILLLVAFSAATTTTQPSKSEILKAEWNRTICIALHVLQIVSVGIGALLIMIAGLKYMSSEDADDRNEARNMIMRVIGIFVIIAVTAQVVNYLVAGTRIGSIDIDSCSDLFPTTTLGGGPTTSPTLATTSTTTNGTTTTVVTTTSSTTTTSPLSCTDPSNPYSIGGSKDACQRASSIGFCNTDFYPNGGNGVTDLDDIPYLGRGFSSCCCANGFNPQCCGIKKMS